MRGLRNVFERREPIDFALRAIAEAVEAIDEWDEESEPVIDLLSSESPSVGCGGGAHVFSTHWSIVL